MLYTKYLKEGPFHVKNDIKQNLFFIFHFSIFLAHREFVSMTGYKDQLFKNCSGKSRVDVENGSKMMATGVFDQRNTWMGQTSDPLVKGNSSIGTEIANSKGKLIGLSKEPVKDDSIFLPSKPLINVEQVLRSSHNNFCYKPTNVAASSRFIGPMSFYSNTPVDTENVDDMAAAIAAGIKRPHTACHINSHFAPTKNVSQAAIKPTNNVGVLPQMHLNQTHVNIDLTDKFKNRKSTPSTTDLSKTDDYVSFMAGNKPSRIPFDPMTNSAWTFWGNS